MKTLVSAQLQTNSPLSCPICSHKLDGVTGEVTMPKDGDFSICIACGTILQFRGKGMGLSIEEANYNELQELKIKQPDTYAQLMIYRQTILSL